MKLLHTELDKALEGMARNVGEIVEMQRLSDDRHKQEWAVFQAEDQKRWSAFRGAHDERWREHDRIHEKQAAETAQLQSTASQAPHESVQLGDHVQKRVAQL